MAKIVTEQEAAAQLTELLDLVSRGQEVVIRREGSEAVGMVSSTLPAEGRRLGALKGQISFSDEFWDPLPEEELLPRDP